MRTIFDDVEYEKDTSQELRAISDKYLDKNNKFILDGIKASIFITGEVGTGKSRAVRAIKKHFDKEMGEWFTKIYNFTEMAIRIKINPENQDELKLDDIANFK